MTDDRRLIEDYLPIQAISAEASREKSVRKGHISTLHLWWARRPLVACRAAVYGALVPASQFVPQNGGGTEQQKKALGRAHAKEFLSKLCQYPGSPDVIKEAQEHILKAHAERLTRETGKPVTVEDIVAGRAPRPKVLDMFAGGGAIPLEALRLGCESYALDLNPVAHIIQLCTLVYPQKFGKPDPTAKGSAKDGTWAGLAAEVEHWGRWVLEKVKAEIGDLYPPIPDPEYRPRMDANGHECFEEPQQVMGFAEDQQLPLGATPQSAIRNPQSKGFLTPVAYLWTRTVRCKNPACSATVPLVKQTWLCKKKDWFVAMRLVASKGEKRVRFEIVEAPTEADLGFDPEAFSKGGNATCPFCGTVADNDYIKSEGCAGRIGRQPMALVCTRKGNSGKVYLSPDAARDAVPGEELVEVCLTALIHRTKLTAPEEPMPVQGTLGFRIQAYGVTTWGGMFTPRQSLCLLAFASSVRDAEAALVAKSYGKEQTKAVLTGLAAVLDRLADFNSMGCTWNYTGGRGVLHTMARQALPMTWDFAETDPFNPAGASWVSGIEDVPAAFEELAKIDLWARVVRAPAMQMPFESGSIDCVVTDPPYYDNVPYADISDFFYVWLRRTIGHLYPEHFASAGTPKKQEAIAEPARYGGDKTKAKQAYEAMMEQSFAEACRVLKPGGQMSVVYAHKTTLGWATLIDALRRAGFTVTEAWPLDTERAGRLRAMDSAALATSITLVSRKRDGAKTGSYEDEVRPELEQIVRERVETLWRMGITGADLIIAAVGAGLRAFTRFARVEYANGEEVPAERFLGEVESVVLETLLEKIFADSRGSGRLLADNAAQAGEEALGSNSALPTPHSAIGSVDGPSRFYVLWRYAYRTADLDAGEAIVFTYGQPVELEGADGLTAGTLALVEKKKGKYRLPDYTERGPLEKLGLPDDEGKPAPLVDALHRLLWLMEHEPRKLPAFLDEARPDRERLRLVAQALAGAGLSGGSEDQTGVVNTTPGEQAALGKLLANWRALVPETLFAR
jgi:putative DNA methylase